MTLSMKTETGSFPGGSDGKESTCNAGDLGLIPGSGRSPGEGNGNPLCLRFPFSPELLEFNSWKLNILMMQFNRVA